MWDTYVLLGDTVSMLLIIRRCRYDKLSVRNFKFLIDEVVEILTAGNSDMEENLKLDEEVVHVLEHIIEKVRRMETMKRIQ